MTEKSKSQSSFQAEKLCDRVAILRKGQLVREGAMERVRGDDTLEEVFLELEDTGEAL